MQEGGARFGQDLGALTELAVDVDPPPTTVRHPGCERQGAVDEDRAPVAYEDPRRHGGEAVPRREQPARLVERGADESSVHDPGPGLVTLAEREGRLVALDSLLGRARKVEAVPALVPAAPARRIVVRGNLLYRRPPRSKWAL
jgi:hypothetical protein